MPEKTSSTQLAKKQANVKRATILSSLKRKNLDMAHQINRYLLNHQVDQSNKDHLIRIYNNIRDCANLSLFRHSHNSNEWTYMTSATCDNKNCFICNWNRQKAIRRKISKWFRENKTILLIQKGESKKSVTKSSFNNKWKAQGYEVFSEREYDVMTMTLTVPHYENGWNGKKFYYKEISDLFNLMRKNKEWLNWVFGGEYGIETTKNDNGLHIHIHSLLLVRKGRGNRNILSEIILRLWNNLSINYDSKRVLTEEAIAGILAGNKTLSRDQVLALDPRGATSISLESVYYRSRSGKKQYVNDLESKEMIYAVMEAVSYHFAPQTFDKDNNQIDLPLLAEIATEIYSKALYKKFGCWHGEKSLNIKANGFKEEFTEVNSLEGFDPETGEIFDNQEIEFNEFYFLNPAFVFSTEVKGEKKIKISKTGFSKAKKIDVSSSTQAIEFMTASFKHKSN